MATTDLAVCQQADAAGELQIVQSQAAEMVHAAIVVDRAACGVRDQRQRGHPVVARKLDSVAARGKTQHRARCAPGHGLPRGEPKLRQVGKAGGNGDLADGGIARSGDQFGGGRDVTLVLAHRMLLSR